MDGKSGLGSWLVPTGSPRLVAHYLLRSTWRTTLYVSLTVSATLLAPIVHAQRTTTADERRVMTLDMLSAHGLLAAGGQYVEKLVREPTLGAYQVLYQARDSKGALLLFSKSLVKADEGQSFVAGFLWAHTPSFLNVVRSEWGLSTDGAQTNIDEDATKGKIYELTRTHEHWGYLFAGQMSLYPVYIIVAKVPGLDRDLFIQMLREHARVLQVLPPSGAPSDVPLQRRSFKLGELTINVKTPGDLRMLQVVEPPAKEVPSAAAQTYAYVGRFPLDLSIGWSGLLKGPANLRSGAEGALRAIARMPNVDGLRSTIEATKISDLDGFRISATFMAGGQAMSYDAVVFTRGPNGWNVSVVVPASDVSARRAALEIVGSVQLGKP